MNRHFLQVFGIVALGYITLRVGLWALANASYAMSSFASWIRWSGIPTIFSIAVACGVIFFLWQMLFGRER